jgi:hypothetical protein
MQLSTQSLTKNAKLQGQCSLVKAAHYMVVTSAMQVAIDL